MEQLYLIIIILDAMEYTGTLYYNPQEHGNIYDLGGRGGSHQDLDSNMQQ